MDQNQAWTICVFFVCCTVVLWRYFVHRENMAGVFREYGEDEEEDISYSEFERMVSDAQKEESVESEITEADVRERLAQTTD